MGLDTFAAGMSWELGYHKSYRRFNRFRDELVRLAYDEICYKVYHEYERKAENWEIEHWNAVCNDDLDLLLFHEDDRGKFSYLECRKIYRALCLIDPSKSRNNPEFEIDIALWKNIFMYCARRRVNLYFR